MAITALEGNEVISLRDMSYQGTVFSKGSKFTIDKVCLGTKKEGAKIMRASELMVVFSLKEMPNIRFDEQFEIFEDAYPLDEFTIMKWCDDSNHPEGL
jgi:hypothetical protein